MISSANQQLSDFQLIVRSLTIPSLVLILVFSVLKMAFFDNETYVGNITIVCKGAGKVKTNEVTIKKERIIFVASDGAVKDFPSEMCALSISKN